MIENKDEFTKTLGCLNKDSQVVSANVLDKINQVFYADGISSVLSDNMDLSVRYVTDDQFHELLGGSLSANFEPKTIYMVSSDWINAHNTRIVNVGDPEDGRDAANRQFVESVVQEAISGLVRMLQDRGVL